MGFGSWLGQRNGEDLKVDEVLEWGGVSRGGRSQVVRETRILMTHNTDEIICDYLRIIKMFKFGPYMISLMLGMSQMGNLKIPL